MKIIQICYKRNFHLSLAKYKWEFYETGSEFKNAQVWQKHAKMYEWRHSTHLIRIVWRLAWLLCTLFYGKFYTFGIVGTETSTFKSSSLILSVHKSQFSFEWLSAKEKAAFWNLVWFSTTERGLSLKLVIIIKEYVAGKVFLGCLQTVRFTDFLAEIVFWELS